MIEGTPTGTPLPPPAAPELPGREFKPNIYPVMYWALAFGTVAGLLLFLISILSRFITLLWFPVFLGGLIWGGYRNYKKQKSEWFASSGVVPKTDTPLNEFKQAVQDIREASRDLMSQEDEGQPSAAETEPEIEPTPAPESEQSDDTVPPGPTVPPL